MYKPDMALNNLQGLMCHKTCKPNWMVCQLGGKWPYSCCLMGWCFKNLFRTVWRILV